VRLAPQASSFAHRSRESEIAIARHSRESGNPALSLLVIPAKAGIQFFLGLCLSSSYSEARASTPPAEAPLLVIPAKAGIQFLHFVSLFVGVAGPELPLLLRRRPCSSFPRKRESSSFFSFRSLLVLQSQSFHSSCGGAGHFSLLVQGKVTKRKHAPIGRALRASCPAGSRAHSGVRRTHIPVRSAKRVHRARAPCGA